MAYSQRSLLADSALGLKLQASGSKAVGSSLNSCSCPQWPQVRPRRRCCSSLGHTTLGLSPNVSVMVNV